MGQIYNIYCDESCHLENSKDNSMVLGGIWCLADKYHDISKRILEIKSKYKIAPDFEIKWTKVSPAKKNFYLELIDYFFDDDDIHFRCVVVPDKSKLDHEKFDQTHDQFYYKLYFDMLKNILTPNEQYRIYIDIKDTRGAMKVKKLQEVLCNNMYDFDRKIVQRFQQVRSHEVTIMQVTDLLIGAVSYLFRALQTNSAKKELVERIKERSGYSLYKSTLLKEEKFNLLVWEPS
ncbi:DUF3800 domain-containing protein [Candidatus Peregrinibacteria bacterium]|nr:DUF3800 domain-containing protein [Candidatus Peregrinibacteria bacterium]